MEKRRIRKRCFKCFLLALIMVFVLLEGSSAKAASYPAMIPKITEQTVKKGQIAKIEFSYFPEYKNEKVYVDVYDSDGNQVATSTHQFYNISDAMQTYTVTWDTADIAPGRYKVIAKMDFYSFLKWNEAPRSSTCYLIVEEYGNSETGSGSSETTDSNQKNDGSSGKYSNEWVNGRWYNEDGSQTYKGTLTWKSNSKGWWVEDSAGWYPTNKWQKIDGKSYYFKPDGYMASEEYYNGYWFNKNGSWDSTYKLSWKCNATGWWVEDVSGWWPSNKWLKIDGDWYYFNSSGYMVTNQYVGGWWIGSDGVCR